MSDPTARIATALADRYRIERQLGQGGMATVYLAHDLKHDRKVALKVLRPELAAVIGAERFHHEITVTANLQHPHILPLHDSGSAGGFLYYVMPYVEGETLREKLAREKQLPIEEAVQLTREVASALDYAHRQGIVHRDIKPENVLLHDGQALVADFGIARALSRVEATRLTETGVALGTPQYMSPEQAAGDQDVTPRADVYSLAVMLYEMLAGDPPYGGSTAQAIFARVITEKAPPVTAARDTVSPALASAVHKGLAKLPADRFSTAAAFADALTRSTPETTAPAVASPAALPPYRLSALFAFATLAAVAAWGWLRGRTASAQQATWQYVSFGDSVAPGRDVPTLALSPDGSTLVFRDNRSDGRLWIKRLGTLDPVPLPGTERSFRPTFSPDGAWIAFEQVGTGVEKVRVSGGAPVLVANGAAGAVWMDDGSMIVQTRHGLRRVWPGGNSQPVALRDTALPGNVFGLYMTALPGARGLLFSTCVSPCLRLQLHVIDLRTGTQKRLLDQADVVEAWYVRGGHLLYVRRDGVIMAAPFDLATLRVTGDPISVLDDVGVGNLAVTDLAWSRSGSLVYARGGGTAADNAILQVDRRGAITSMIDTAVFARFNSVAMAPDGRRFAAGNGPDIWIQDLQGGPLTKVTSRPGATRPTWSPDGRRIAFLRDSAGAGDAFVQPTDGSGMEREVAHFRQPLEEVVWSHDGRWLIVRTDDDDIVGVRTSGDTTPVLLVHDARNPTLSPDDRWLAYWGLGGAGGIYVRPFPNTNARRWQVSDGWNPVWSPTGRELFYMDFNSRLVAARVQTAPTFAVESRTVLFSASTLLTNGQHQTYDVAPDGHSFFFIGPRRPRPLDRPPQIVWVDHWFSAIEGKLGS